MKSSRHVPAPKWLWLYALIPLTLGLFWFADFFPEGGVWRIISECGVTSALFGLAIVWVRANRIPLTQMNLGAVTDSGVSSPESIPRFSVRRRRISQQAVAAPRAPLRAVQ